MSHRHAIIVEDEEEDLQIPEDAFTFEGFQRWMESDDFPETGRIDYLEGDVYVDMSPEDLYTHSTPKTAIASTLIKLVVDPDLGELHIDRTRNVSRFAGLSVEPDLVMVLLDSLRQGKIRPVPASRKKPDRFIALEGPADLVVEIVSDSSVKKDTVRLPPLYAKAGVPELWLIDARGEDLRFDVFTLRDGQYELVAPDAGGWTPSPLLRHAFRFVRYRRPDLGTWRYSMEHREG
ncbi:MAG TPA: Uma2 family endonuclease [Thermoanaerobaculia bacterium]|jgi:Uma2 family endonuclease|nr:Uma2 family endonuclease [Thermoanaerobaculia bacterium]